METSNYPDAHWLIRLADPDLVQHIQEELNQITQTGIIRTRFYLELENGGFGEYQIQFTSEEAKSYAIAAENFLKKPWRYSSFANAMTSELESLLCGGQPRRYKKIS